MKSHGPADAFEEINAQEAALGRGHFPSFDEEDTSMHSVPSQPGAAGEKAPKPPTAEATWVPCPPQPVPSAGRMPLTA